MSKSNEKQKMRDKKKKKAMDVASANRRLLLGDVVSDDEIDLLLIQYQKAHNRVKAFSDPTLTLFMDIVEARLQKLEKMKKARERNKR